MLFVMSSLPRRPVRASRPVRIVVLGDLVLDVVLAPERTLVAGTDVPGRVSLSQGGSAASTARWLARLGARATLITSVGRDTAGRALLAGLRDDGVVVHAARPAGRRTGRIGVIVGSHGERSFVADREAADELAPGDLRASWFRGVDALHLPFYSLVGQPLGEAGARAIQLARAAGARISLDLASSGPLLAGGRRAAVRQVAQAAPDVLFATADEAQALLGEGPLERLLSLTPLAVVKRGAKGATVLAQGGGAEASDRLRFEVATRPIEAIDTTGAGDAFDAGFLATWLQFSPEDVGLGSALRRSAVAGHRAAARQLTAPRRELSL